MFTAFKRLFADEIGAFKTLLTIAAIIVVILFAYNVVSGSKGTYSKNGAALARRILTAGAFASPKASSTASNESKGETECRRAIESLTRRPFPKQRPPFLKNAVTSSNLELDCYNAELALAVEYNGRQHYEYTPHFHATRDAFYNTKYRDEEKKRLCAMAGVRLIVVPYTVDVADIESFIAARTK